MLQLFRVVIDRRHVSAIISKTPRYTWTEQNEKMMTEFTRPIELDAIKLIDVKGYQSGMSRSPADTSPNLPTSVTGPSKMFYLGRPNEDDPREVFQESSLTHRILLHRSSLASSRLHHNAELRLARVFEKVSLS